MARGLGEGISVTWMLIEAKSLFEERHQTEFHLSRHWAQNVLDRNNMSLRAPQNIIKEGLSVALPRILGFHSNLRKYIGSKRWRDLEWRAFPPKHQWNVD